MIQIHEFIAENPGPHLLILGGIHGNEVCGPRALHALVDEIRGGARKLERGRLTLVPTCNPKAYAENRRFIEENLNRVFEATATPTSYERRLAQTLIPLIERCDYLLDLHSMQSAGDPFAVLNTDRPESIALCRALGTKFVLAGWPEVYQKHPDKNASCTQTCADRYGKPNALIECGTHGTPEADLVAKEAVRRALAHFGMSHEKLVPGDAPKTVRLLEVFFRDAPGDRLERVFGNFDPLRKGQDVLFREDGRVVRAPDDGVIVFPSQTSAVGTEIFYFGRFEG